jgi:hypothetical protein
LIKNGNILKYIIIKLIKPILGKNKKGSYESGGLCFQQNVGALLARQDFVLDFFFNNKVIDEHSKFFYRVFFSEVIVDSI